MSVTKPTALEWASSSNGADSKAAVPSSGRKSNGYDGSTFPEFTYENWYKRQTMLWQQWLDQQEQYSTAGVSALLGTSGSFNATFNSAVVVSFNYIKYASGLVRIWWPNITGLVSDTINQSTADVLTTPVLLPSATRNFPVCLGLSSPELGVIRFTNQTSLVGKIYISSLLVHNFTEVGAGIIEYFI